MITLVRRLLNPDRRRLPIDVTISPAGGSGATLVYYTVVREWEVRLAGVRAEQSVYLLAGRLRPFGVARAGAMTRHSNFVDAVWAARDILVRYHRRRQDQRLQLDDIQAQIFRQQDRARRQGPPSTGADWGSSA